MTDKPKPTGRAARPTDDASVAARENLARWTKAFSDQVVENVIHYRNDRKLRNDELRARLKQLGWVLTENSLAGILGKKRATMPITDVMLFAWALNVPPLALLFPLHSNAPVAITPREEGRPVPYQDRAYNAARWFVGQDGFANSGTGIERDMIVDDYYEIGDIMGRVEEIDDAMRSLAAINRVLMSGDSPNINRTQLQKQAQDYMETVRDLRRYLRSSHPEMELPKLDGALSVLNDRHPAYPMLPISELVAPPLAANAYLESDEAFSNVQTGLDRIAAEEWAAELAESLRASREDEQQ